MSRTITILCANGVNLDLLGKRESSQYGSFTLLDLETFLRAEIKDYASLLGMKNIKLECFQSNSEKEFLEHLTATDFCGAIINPGAWTHTSLALADRLATVKYPYMEVHISNLATRESFRQKSFSAANASGVVYGLGMYSYSAALFGLLQLITGKKI